MRALRRLPGFAAIYKTARISATATTAGLLGFRHSRMGALWLAEALTGLPGNGSPRVLAYLPADPSTAAAIARLAGDGPVGGTA